MLSIPYVSCHSNFCCDFKVCSDYVFVDDFRSVVTHFSQTIPCINDDSVFSIDFMRQSWISIRCRFHPSAVPQFSKIISRSTVTQFLRTISGSALGECVWQFHALAMDLFLVSIWYVGRAVDSISQLSLKFLLWFQGLQCLCFRWWFLDISVADSLVITSVTDDSIFSIDFICESWISIRCRFHPSLVTQFSKIISRSILTQFFVGRVCLTIPCVSHESIFGFDLMRRSCC